MYFIKDNSDKYECILIINERCYSEMSEKLKEFFGDIKEIQILVLHESKKVRIGFVVDEEKEVSFGQPKNKHKENADTIISNCEWIIFPSKEYEFFGTVSKMCGKEYDYYGMEHDLVGVSEMQHLKKYADGGEALILKNGQYPFITKLPDYEHTDVFERYPEATLDEVKSNFTSMFLGFHD